MAATVRSAGSSNSGSSAVTSFSPTMPAGLAAGDLLIGIACNSGAVPNSRPSGSTAVINVADGVVFNLDVVRKTAAGGDVFTWGTSSVQKWAGCVIAVRVGTFDTTTPVTGAVGVATGTTATTTYTTPSSTPNADSLIIAAFGNQAASTWTNADTSPLMLEVADTTSTGTGPASLGVYVSFSAPAASSLTRVGTSSVSSANGAAFLLFVNPGPPKPEWLQRSPRPMEQPNVAGPYAAPASFSQFF